MRRGVLGRWQGGAGPGDTIINIFTTIMTIALGFTSTTAIEVITVFKFISIDCATKQFCHSQKIILPLTWAFI